MVVCCQEMVCESVLLQSYLLMALKAPYPYIDFALKKARWCPSWNLLYLDMHVTIRRVPLPRVSVIARSRSTVLVELGDDRKRYVASP